jgi:hypothetical protein
VEQRDGGSRVRGEHVVNGDQDSLDRVDPLKLPEEVDVEGGVLGALSRKGRRALRLRLRCKLRRSLGVVWVR